MVFNLLILNANIKTWTSSIICWTKAMLLQ